MQENTETMQKNTDKINKNTEKNYEIQIKYRKYTDNTKNKK